MRLENREFYGIVAQLEYAKSLLSDDNDHMLDIRLQYSHGAFYVHSGDPCYDLDHSGIWACGTVDQDTDCTTLAVDLFHEIDDQEYVSEWEYAI